MPIITVIVPTFNRAGILPRAVESVLRQDFADFELLIADDGSTDGTEMAVKRLIDTDARIRYLRLPENRGVSAARNFAAAQARGEWLAFLDSDDEWLPGKLSLQMRLTPDFDFIHGEETWIRNGNQVKQPARFLKSGGAVFRRCVDLCFIAPSSVLMKRALFESLGGFREDFPVCEDYDLWLKVAHGREVGFISEPVVKKFGGHEDQLSRAYPAMDYYRVKALLPWLDAGLPSGDREHVASTIREKCEVLLNGYRKHGHPEKAAEVEGWLGRVNSPLRVGES